MGVFSKGPAAFVLLAVLAVPAGGVLAQDQQQPDARDPNIVVNGERPAAPVTTGPGPEVKGVIAARNGNRIKVIGADGAPVIVTFTLSLIHI